MSEKPREFRVRGRLKEKPHAEKVATPSEIKDQGMITEEELIASLGELEKSLKEEDKNNGEKQKSSAPQNGHRTVVARSLADLGKVMGVEPTIEKKKVRSNRKAKPNKERVSQSSPEQPVPPSLEHPAPERSYSLSEIASAAADELLDGRPRDVATHQKDVEIGIRNLHAVKDAAEEKAAFDESQDAAIEENKKQNLAKHVDAMRRLRIAAQETKVQKQERREHTKKIRDIHVRKDLERAEDAYVESPQSLRSHEEREDFYASAYREAVARREKYAREEQARTSEESPTEKVPEAFEQVQNQSSEEQLLGGRYSSLPALRLSFLYNNSRLASYVRREAKLQDALDQKRVEVQELSRMRDALRATMQSEEPRAPESYAEVREGLRSKHRVSEKAWRAFDAEERKLTAQLNAAMEQSQEIIRNLREAEAHTEVYSTTCKAILERVRLRAEQIIAPYDAELRELGEKRDAAQDSLERFGKIMARVEARIMSNKDRLLAATFGAEKVMLTDWIKKDVKLFKRMRDGSGKGYAGFTAWQGKIRTLDARIIDVRSAIEGQRALVGSMREQFEQSFELPAQAPESAPSQQAEAPQASQEMSQHGENADTQTHSQEAVARTYSGLWNSRFGSKYQIRPGEFENLLPHDHEPTQPEIESALETHMTLRPKGLWRLPGLGWLYKIITRNRIRSLRGSM